ncbi:MAG: SCP2 sterol-binding domain-containing protein [Thermoleophilia bacterium]
MGTFKSAEEFEKMLGGFFEYLAMVPSIAEKLLASKLIIRFTYTDPDVALLVDCSGDTVEIHPGDRETKATVDMSMTADVAHHFWFGKVNLMMALTRKQMVAKGPVPKILELLPAIKPAYTLYPQYLRENGYARYLVD